MARKPKARFMAIASRDIAMKVMEPVTSDLKRLIDEAAKNGCCKLKLKYGTRLGDEAFCNLSSGQKDTLRKWVQLNGYEWHEDYFGDVTISW